MRIGPKEKQILLKLTSGEYTPPSVYMGNYGSCPSGYTLNRIVYRKKLAVFRHQSYTPEEAKRLYGQLTPGREAAEHNAALMPTKEGEEVIAKLRLVTNTRLTESSRQERVVKHEVTYDERRSN